MGETARRSIQASREHVESLAKMSRSMNAQKATRISPSADGGGTVRAKRLLG